MKTSESAANPRIHIRDLREHLEKNGISPESFASDVHLSHMTIRRWLKKKDDDLLPQKYSAVLRQALSITPVQFPQIGGVAALKRMNMREMMTDLEKSGREYGRGPEVLEKDLKSKLKSARLDQIFADYCKRLLRAIRNPKTPLRVKAICVGALLYFISPIDLIPDNIPVVGYLDDLVVLSIAVNVLADSDRALQAQISINESQ